MLKVQYQNGLLEDFWDCWRTYSLLVADRVSEGLTIFNEDFIICFTTEGRVSAMDIMDGTIDSIDNVSLAVRKALVVSAINDEIEFPFDFFDFFKVRFCP